MIRVIEQLSIFLFLSCAIAFAQGENQAYLPLTPSELGSPFRLSKVGMMTASSLPLHTHAGPSGSTYDVQHDQGTDVLELKGTDKAGKPWQAKLLRLIGCAGGAHIYESDLDRNGIEDALLWTSTCANGLAPKVHLVTVTFDDSGRPIPFEAEGYFAETPSGIDFLVDLNQDGKADLIFMNFSDGYWITNVYSVSAGHWELRQGPFAGRVFPLYTRYTYQPNKRAVTPPPARHPFAPDLSNARPVMQGKLSSWEWPNDAALRNGSIDRDVKLTVMPGGKKIVCEPAYWNDSAKLVVDTPEGRSVERLSKEEHVAVDPVLQRAVSDRQDVRFYGRRYPDHCSPELMWIDSR